MLVHVQSFMFDIDLGSLEQIYFGQDKWNTLYVQ